MERFLRGAWIAKLATNGKDGSPHVMPCWYEWEGGNLYVITKPHVQTVQNLKHDSRVYVLIDKPSYPYMRVNFRGKGRIVRMDWSDMVRRMTERYMGRRALRYHGERLKHPGVVIKVTPELVSTWVPTTFPPDRTFFRRAAWRRFRKREIT